MGLRAERAGMHCHVVAPSPAQLLFPSSALCWAARVLWTRQDTRWGLPASPVGLLPTPWVQKLSPCQLLLLGSGAPW